MQKTVLSAVIRCSHTVFDSLMTTQIHDLGSHRHSIICSFLKSVNVSTGSGTVTVTYGYFEFQYY
jgi:hypothetical protein